LEYIDIPKPLLVNDEVLIETKAIGLNYADIYRRKGNYHLNGSPPFIAGYEGAGIIVEANMVEGFKNGDRIAFADVPFANSQFVKVPKSNIIPLPENISFEKAAAVLLQGLTAQYLVQDSFVVKHDDIVLIHACAGGVGTLLVQMCKMKGAYVIGLTSSNSKKEIALSNGCDKVFLYDEDWANLAKSERVTVVYESIGSTLLQSFKTVIETGSIVFYGFAGGNPPHIDPRMLMDGSKKLIGGDLWSYFNTQEQRLTRCNELFEWIFSGKINIQEPTKFSLSDGKKAHELLESRKSTGKIILIP
jgi:NADPH:quinone reductase